MSLYAAFLLLAGAAQFLSVSAKSISFDDCGSKVGKLVSIDITPCKAEPCTLYKGQNVTCTIIFIPSEVVSSGKMQVYGIISEFKVPWKSWNLCNLTKCPVKSGQDTKIVLTLVVSPKYPSLKLVIDMEMKDQKGLMVFCAKFAAEIKSKDRLRAVEQGRELVDKKPKDTKA